MVGQLETGPSTYPFVAGISYLASAIWHRNASGVCLTTNPQGGLAQLGEHLLCKQGVTGSIPVASTKFGWGKLGRGKLGRGRLRRFGPVSRVIGLRATKSGR